MSVGGIRWRDLISVLSFVALLVSFPFGWMQVTDNSWQIDEDLTVVTAGGSGGGLPQEPPTIKGTQIQAFDIPLLSIVVGVFIFFLILLAVRYFRGVESFEMFGRRFSFDWVLALVVYVLYYVVTNAGPGYGQLEPLNLRAAGVVAHNSMGIAMLAYIVPGVRQWWKRRR
jgi:hypothetical protein